MYKHEPLGKDYSAAENPLKHQGGGKSITRRERGGTVARTGGKQRNSCGPNSDDTGGETNVEDKRGVSRSILQNLGTERFRKRKGTGWVAGDVFGQTRQYNAKKKMKGKQHRKNGGKIPPNGLDWSRKGKIGGKEVEKQKRRKGGSIIRITLKKKRRDGL